jgi:hypothetical protein
MLFSIDYIFLFTLYLPEIFEDHYIIMRASILSSALLFWLGFATSLSRVRQGDEPKSVVIRAGVVGNYSTTFSIGSQSA